MRPCAVLPATKLCWNDMTKTDLTFQRVSIGLRQRFSHASGLTNQLAACFWNCMVTGCTALKFDRCIKLLIVTHYTSWKMSYRLNPYAGKWNIPKSFVTKDPFVFPGVSYSQTSFVTKDPFVFPRFCHYSISIHLEDVDPFDGISNGDGQNHQLFQPEAVQVADLKA